MFGTKFLQNTHDGLLGKAFLDCGAYSVATGAVPELNVSAYAEFCNVFHDKFSAIAAPDIIGDLEGTLSNLKKFMPLVSFPKEKILATHHVMRGNVPNINRTLDSMEEYGITWIALGGIVGIRGKGNDEKIKTLHYAFNEIAKRKTKIKVHIFGVYDMSYVKMFEPDSVDSATQIHTGKKLEELTYDPKTWKHSTVFRPEYKTDGKALVNFAVTKLIENSDLYQDKLKGYSRSDLEFEIRKFPDSYKMMMANNIESKRIELIIQNELKPDFKYYNSFSFGFIPSDSYLLCEVMKDLLLDRTLVPYTILCTEGKEYRNKINYWG